jgi:hypothetical protein
MPHNFRNIGQDQFLRAFLNQYEKQIIIAAKRKKDMKTLGSWEVTAQLNENAQNALKC